MTTHELKVVPPYFDSLVAGSKTFEVRRNDRGFQRGDVLRLREWHPYAGGTMTRCAEEGCDGWTTKAHWATCRETVIRTVGFVFSGDPRFGGIEPGHVVLSLLSEHAKPDQPDTDENGCAMCPEGNHYRAANDPACLCCGEPRPVLADQGEKP